MTDEKHDSECEFESTTIEDMASITRLLGIMDPGFVGFGRKDQVKDTPQPARPNLSMNHEPN